MYPHKDLYDGLQTMHIRRQLKSQNTHDVSAERALALYMADPAACPGYRHHPPRNHNFSNKLVNCKRKCRHNECEIYNDSNVCFGGTLQVFL